MFHCVYKKTLLQQTKTKKIHFTYYRNGILPHPASNGQSWKKKTVPIATYNGIDFSADWLLILDTHYILTSGSFIHIDEIIAATVTNPDTFVYSEREYAGLSPVGPGHRCCFSGGNDLVRIKTCIKAQGRDKVC